VDAASEIRQRAERAAAGGPDGERGQ
jgi:hypothetical protein